MSLRRCSCRQQRHSYAPLALVFVGWALWHVVRLGQPTIAAGFVLGNVIHTRNCSPSFLLSSSRKLSLLHYSSEGSSSLNLPRPDNKNASQKPPKKKRRKKTQYKHLFRHYDDVSFDSLLRCSNPLEFLQSIGYTDDELQSQDDTNEMLWQQNVHSSLAPKARFLVETLQGGTGVLDWVDEAHQDLPASITINKNNNDEEEDEECHPEQPPLPHTLRLYPETKRVVPLEYYLDGKRLLLDRRIAPRHAYLQHHDLVYGKDLIFSSSSPNPFGEFLKTCETESTDNFVDYCNQLEQKMRPQKSRVHSKDTVALFERLFCPGLLPVVRAPDEPTFASRFLTSDSLVTLPPSTRGQMVRLLLQHGANHLETDTYNMVTPLHWAAGTGSVESVNALMDVLQSHVAMPNPTDENDTSLLDTEVILQHRSAKDGATALHWAACGIEPGNIGYGGSLDVCRAILDRCHGRVEEVVNAATYTDASTPFMWAAWSGSLSVTKLLLEEYGADPTVQDSRRGGTAAHWAAAAGHADVCQYLLSNTKLDFALPDDEVMTPLDYALRYDRRNVIQLLQDQSV